MSVKKIEIKDNYYWEDGKRIRKIFHHIPESDDLRYWEPNLVHISKIEASHLRHKKHAQKWFDLNFRPLLAEAHELGKVWAWIEKEKLHRIYRVQKEPDGLHWGFDWENHSLEWDETLKKMVPPANMTPVNVEFGAKFLKAEKYQHNLWHRMGVARSFLSYALQRFVWEEVRKLPKIQPDAPELFRIPINGRDYWYTYGRTRQGGWEVKTLAWPEDTTIVLEVR